MMEIQSCMHALTCGSVHGLAIVHDDTRAETRCDDARHHITMMNGDALLYYSTTVDTGAPY